MSKIETCTLLRKL